MAQRVQVLRNELAAAEQRIRETNQRPHRVAKRLVSLRRNRAPGAGRHQSHRSGGRDRFHHGPLGWGKTTLIKIMLGLLEPTTGEILIDGVPLQTVGVRPYREQVAAVMQEDPLLSGSIADNICFFDPDFDQGRMIECAQLAGIHNEIMAMPMTYNCLVGDMGSSLSGGQKQRVLLARALYRQPRMLFLDEGTAHLDVANEPHQRKPSPAQDYSHQRSPPARHFGGSRSCHHCSKNASFGSSTSRLRDSRGATNKLRTSGKYIVRASDKTPGVS